MGSGFVQISRRGVRATRQGDSSVGVATIPRPSEVRPERPVYRRLPRQSTASRSRLQSNHQPVNIDTAELLSMAAHELRAPLSALAMAAEFLAEDYDQLDQHEVSGMITAIHRSSLWLQGLVENLLSAATIHQGRLQVLVN